VNNKLSLLVNFVGVDKMSGALRNIIGLGGKGSKSLRELGGEAKKLQREIADYDRQIERTTGNVTNLFGQQRQAMERLEEVQRRIARQQRLAAIEADRQAMRRRGTELRSKGTENVAGGVAAAAPLIYAVTKAAEFSSVMVDIQQKAELSDQATKGLANNILLSARAARLLPADMAAAVDTLSGLGLDPKQAVEAAAPMGKFMTAFKVEGTDAAAAVYAGVSNLKIPLAQTAKLLDMMAAGGNQGAFEVRDMAAAFPGLTAQMQALGQTGTRGATELIAMLETIRRGTGDSAAAATNAENLLAKVSSPATTAAFKKNFGIDLPAAIKKGTAAGISPIQTLIALTNKATKGDLSKLGYIFEDMQAQSALRQLIIDQKLFLQMQGKIAAAGGLVDKAFDQRVANDATVSWRELMGSASAVAITLGTTLLPVAKQVMGNLSMAAAKVSDWAKANPELAATLMQGAAALITLKIGLGAAQIAFGSILGPIGDVWAMLRKSKDAIGGIKTAYTQMAGKVKYASSVANMAFNSVKAVASSGLAGAKVAAQNSFSAISLAAGKAATRTRSAMTSIAQGAVVMGKAIWGAMTTLAQGIVRLGVFMMANPIVLVITAIVVAIGVAAYLIYTHWDRIKATFQAGWAFLTAGWTAFKNWISGVGGNLMDGIINGLKAGWSGLKSVWNTIVSYLPESMRRKWEIHSPSRVFMRMGGNVADGLALGVDRGAPRAQASMSRLAGGVMAAGAMSLTPFASAARPAAGPTVTAQRGGDTYHFHITQQPGENAEAFAKRVQELIEQAADRKRRREYGDN
jgi:TP901 family phage tail tape measure protein